MLLAFLLLANLMLQANSTTLLSSLSNSSTPVKAFLLQHGYAAIFALLALEYASFPIPTEVVLPFVGYLIYIGKISPIPGFLATMAGAMVGMSVDYYAAYFLGRRIYKRLPLLKLDSKEMKTTEKWFYTHQRSAVFLSRLLPVVRGFVSFAAGFAAMDFVQFSEYSLLGVFVWDTILMMFGYYALLLSEVSLLEIVVVLLTAVVFITYKFFIERIEKEESRKEFRRTIARLRKRMKET